MWLLGMFLRDRCTAQPFTHPRNLPMFQIWNVGGKHNQTAIKEAKDTGLSKGTLGNLKYIGKK